MPYPKKPVLDLGPKNPMLLALEKARKDRLSRVPALTNTKPGAMRRDVAGVSSSAGGSGGGGGGGGGGGMTSWQIKGDSGTTETVINTDLVTIAGGTGLSSVGSSPDTVTLNLDNTAVTPGSYTYASLTVDAQGRLTAASSGTTPYVPGGTDVALADGGTGASLTDPNADRIMFWDDSAGAVTWLAPGTALSISGTTLNCTASGTVGGTGTDNHIARWDGTSDIQDTGWVIDDDDLMSISGAETGYINVTTTNSLSASSGAIEGYGTGFAAGIYGENSGTGAGLYGKNSDAGVGIWGTNSDSVLAAIHGANTNGGPDFEAGNSGIYQAPEITTPANAFSGRRRLYAKSDGWYDMDDAGVETGPFGAGGGGMTSFTLAGDSGSSQTISNGNTLTVAGGSGIATVAGATDTVTASLDIDSLTDESNMSPDDDYLPFYDDSAADNRKINPNELLWELPMRRMPYAFHDFLDVNATSTMTSYWNSLGTLSVSGTSAGILGITGDSAHPGTAGLRTGTSTTGRAALLGNAAGVILGSGEWHFMQISLIAVASDGTNTFYARLGFGDNDAGDPTDGCYFRYTHSVNGGRWEAVTIAGGVSTGTVTDTGVSLDTTNYMKFEIVVNAGATSVDYIINGSTVATHTSNIPSGATGILTGSMIKSAGGTSRQMQIDCVGVHHTLTTRR